MRTTLLLALLLTPPVLQAQTVLFSEDFGSPTPGFTLNTTDVSSTASGANTWLINNAYAGGNGEVVCFGFPFGFTVPPTAAQPAGVTDPNGNYLHTASVAAIGSGVQNCCFIAADGLCTQAGNHFARMSADVSTTGMSTVTLSFWWLCGGGTNNYGEVYYSTNGGGSWSLISTPIAQYRDQATWTQQSVSLPAFAGQAMLRFGFRFVNGTTTAAQDPGFGVDDVRITAEGAAANTITTTTVSPLAYCQGSAIQVPYTATGTFGPSNVFTAQLSNAAGSFAAPVAIGSVTSTATAGTIPATIPPGTVPGSAYRVRVVGSDPATEGSANVANIAIAAAAEAGSDVAVSLCSNGAVPDLLALVDGGALTGDFYYQGLPLLPDLSVAGEYDVLYVVQGAGACPSDTAHFAITVFQAPNAGTGVSITICTSDPPIDLFTLLSGSPDEGGQWFDPEGDPTSGILDPALGPQGLYTYEVPGTAPCNEDQAFVAIVLDPCLGIDELVGGAWRWLGQEGGIHNFAVPVSYKGADIGLVDATGRLLGMEGRAARSTDRIRVDLSDRPTGIYFVRFSTEQVLRIAHTRR